MIYSITVFVNGEVSNYSFNSDEIPFWKRGIYRDLCLFVSKQMLKELENDELIICTNTFKIYGAKLEEKTCIITSERNQSVEELRELSREALICSGDIGYLFRGTKIRQLQTSIFQVKEILVKNITDLHLRKEELEKLIDTSQDLSFQSKIFAKESIKLRNCCVII